MEQFVDTPDHDLICVICRAVLRSPVRLTCNHVFCKECILLWMKRYQQQIIVKQITIYLSKHYSLCHFRQVKCPCCRKSIDQTQMLVLFRLSKSIGRLTIRVGTMANTHLCYTSMQHFKCKLDTTSLYVFSVATNSKAAGPLFLFPVNICTSLTVHMNRSSARMRDVENR